MLAVVPCLIALTMCPCRFQSCIVDIAALKHQPAIACSMHMPLAQHQQAPQHKMHPFWQPISYLHSAAYVEILTPVVIQCTAVLGIYHLKYQHHHQPPPVYIVVLAMCLQSKQQCRTTALTMCLQQWHQCHRATYLQYHLCYHTATMAVYCRMRLPPHTAALATCLQNKQLQGCTLALTVCLLY